jgi:hypothetical protein
MKTVLTTLGVLALTGAAYADASVRVIHASPDAPAVDVLVNGGSVPAFTNFSYGQAVGPVSVPGGSYDIDVVPTGGMAPGVIDVNGLALMDNTDYTIAAINTLANIEPLVLVDDNTLDPSNARIRFVHASPNAPAVDITLSDGTVLFAGTEFGNAAGEGYLSVPGGVYDLQVRLAGTETVVLDLSGTEVDNNTVYSVFALGLVGNKETPLTAGVFVDAIPTPGSIAVMGLAGAFAARRRRA